MSTTPALWTVAELKAALSLDYIGRRVDIRFRDATTGHLVSVMCVGRLLSDAQCYPFGYDTPHPGIEVDWDDLVRLLNGEVMIEFDPTTQTFQVYPVG